MRYCENCGERLEEGEVFCGKCGKSQSQNEQVERPKKYGNKRKYIIGITACILISLVGCGVFYFANVEEKKERTTVKQSSRAKNKEIQKSLKETLKWRDNSEKVEELKKQHVAGYVDVMIGKAMEEEYSVNSWKYAAKNQQEYLMCSYSSEEKLYTLIFYKDIHGNTNVAEYYVEGRRQEKETTNEAVRKIFTVKTPVEESVEEQSAREKSIPVIYPEGGIYTNVRQGGVPYSMLFEVLPRDDVSFSYKIIQKTGETGMEVLDDVIVSGIMTYDVGLGRGEPNRVFFKDQETGAYIAYYDYGYKDNGAGSMVHDITIAIGGLDSITSKSGEQFYKYWIQGINF